MTCEWLTEEMLKQPVGVEEETNKCTNSISFFSHLFAPTCFSHHLTIIRVFNITEYSELQDTVFKECYPILKSSYCVLKN
jgi:hypothetical protein